MRLLPHANVSETRAVRNKLKLFATSPNCVCNKPKLCATSFHQLKPPTSSPAFFQIARSSAILAEFSYRKGPFVPVKTVMVRQVPGIVPLAIPEYPSDGVILQRFHSGYCPGDPYHQGQNRTRRHE